MNKYFLLLVLLATTAAAQSAGPKASIGNSDYSKEAFVIEESSTTINFENDGTSRSEASARIRIQSDAGVQRFGVLTFPYPSSTDSLDIDFVRVKKLDGSVIMTPIDSVQDMPAEITREAPFYSDLHEKHVPVKGLGVGDVLEFKISSRHSNPLAPGQFWYAYNFSRGDIVLQEQLQISYPQARSVKWKSPESKPVIADEGGRRILRWTHSELAHKSDDQRKQDDEDKKYESVRGELPPPDVQVSSFQSWQEVGTWYKDLQKELTKPTQEIRLKEEELTKNTIGENQKAEAIYKYVSTEYRYIGIAFGIGRYQPHAAAEVLGNHYGDCKDKHTLLAALLGAAGIKAFPALISSSHQIDLDVPSPAQFDHVISAMQRDKDLIWLDTTTEVGRFGYLLTPLRGKPALVIMDDQPAALVTTPNTPPKETLQQFTIKAKLNDNGILEGQIARTFEGGDAEVALRTAFRRVPLPQWKDLIQQLSYASGFAGDVSDVTAGVPENLDGPFQFAYKYTRKDYPSWSEARLDPPLPPIALPPVSDADAKPTHPLWLGAPGELRMKAEVDVPKGYTPQLPTKVDLVENFAEYHASSSFKNGIYTTERRLISKVQEIPIDEYDAYKKFQKEVTEDHAKEVVFSLGAASSTLRSYQDEIWDLPYSENKDAAQAYEDAREKAKQQNTQAEVESLKRAVSIDPKFTRAWLWLGEIYKFLRQRDSALDAYRKAIDIDQQPVSYKALGFSLVEMGKPEEAIATWRDLIKTAPDDVDGPRGLGISLMASKRYGEAASAFQSAVNLAPEDPYLHFQLGSAYLRAGEHQKAISTFQETLKLESEPTLLNDIAYDLAETGEDLPLALEYAEKAVREEEDASQWVKLSDLKIEDVRRTMSIAAYWDTLGWVHFRMKNLPAAERYLQPAWQLSQRKVIADHLREVYKAEGKTLSDNFDDSSRVRTTKLPRLASGTASAEFFLVFREDPKTHATTVEDVKFISGSEALQSAGKQLMTAKYNTSFPDSSPTRLVRRGILGCYQMTGCSLVLLNPQDVQSVN